MDSFLIGIDSEGNESFSGSYSMDSSGFAEFLKTIISHCEDLSKVVVGMESTGCYHINLYSVRNEGNGLGPVLWLSVSLCLSNS